MTKPYPSFLESTEPKILRQPRLQDIKPGIVEIIRGQVRCNRRSIAQAIISARHCFHPV